MYRKTKGWISFVMRPLPRNVVKFANKTVSLGKEAVVAEADAVEVMIIKAAAVPLWISSLITLLPVRCVRTAFSGPRAQRVFWSL